MLTPKGEFISAYRMTDGVISHQLVPKVKANYRLVVDTEVTPTGRKKPKKTKGAKASIRVEGKKEDSGGIDEKGEGGGGGGVASGDGGDAPIQLEPVNVYGTRPVHYGSYPTYNGNGIVKEKNQKTNENGRESSSSDVGVGIVKGGKKTKNTRTINDEEEDMITNSLTNPCAKGLVDKAPTLANDIATLLNKTFGTNNNINITFYNKSFGNVTEAAKTYSQGSTDKNGDTFSCDVYLNDDVIKGASQEYILATIYHEVVHAFLRYEHLTLGEKAFNQKYPSVYSKEFFVGNKKQKKMYILIDDKQDHNKFSNFIESLAQSIMSLPGTEISLETARAMAKVGVVENESLSERENYLNTQQKLGKSGITCTPKTP